MRPLIYNCTIQLPSKVIETTLEYDFHSSTFRTGTHKQGAAEYIEVYSKRDLLPFEICLPSDLEFIPATKKKLTTFEIIKPKDFIEKEEKE